MQIYYRDGFYFSDGVTQIPEDAIAITEQTYLALLEGQSQGKEIHTNENGEPFLIEPQPTPYHELEKGQWVISAENQTALFTDYKQSLITQLAKRADQLTGQLLAGYPQSEIESFYRQEKEALAWQADKQTPAPMLRQIAEQRGVPFEILVQKVIEKSNQFAVPAGVIIGQRQKFEDRILSAENEEELTALEQEIAQWTLQI